MSLLFKIKSVQDPAGIPDSLINLLRSSFPYIKDRASFNSYFFNKTLTPPLINWLEHNNEPVAHYSLFEYEFVKDGQIIKAGKPELNVVGQSFTLYCIRARLNYAEMDPMGQLNQLVLSQACQKEYGFLFTWPNEISLNTYKKNGYQIRQAELQLYRKIAQKSFVLKKELSGKAKLLISLISPFFNINLFRFANNLKLQEVAQIEESVYSIEKNWQQLCQQKNSSFYYRKTNELVNKKFSEAVFKKYLIYRRKEVLGYLVLKAERAENYYKLVDQQCSDTVFYWAIAQLPKLNILYRAYQPKNKLLMFLAGFCYYRTLRRDFAYFCLANALADDLKKMPLADFLSDFSG